MIIYEIYEWMGVVGKYTGCFPLPGLYEKREWSKWTKGIINYLIPILNFTFLLYHFGLTLYYNIFLNDFESTIDLLDILIQLFDVCFYAHFFLCIVFNHLWLRRELVSYLKLHSAVDELLKPKQRRLKRFICLFFGVMIVFYTLEEELNRIIDVGLNEYFRSFYQDPSETLKSSFISLTASFIFSIAIFAQPHLMYISFQRVLKSSFDQLLVKIKENQTEELSVEMRVKKMRKYMRLYCDLCKLCSRLDYMVSPLLLVLIVMYYLLQVVRLVLTLTYAELDVHDAFDFVTGFLALCVVSNVAYLTKKSRDKISPVFYSTFNSDEKAVKTELQNFALQSMYFNKSFSASGFIKLDRALILAIVQSLISQTVVFYKIVQEGNQ